MLIVDKCDNPKTVTCNDYSWSNESVAEYFSCFDKMRTKPNKLTSVGAGDHVLFALLYFDSIDTINNIDVSPIALLATLAKLSVINNGSRADWFELLTGSISEKRFMSILEKCGAIDMYTKLLGIYRSKQPSGYGPLMNLSGKSLNIDLFSQESTFETIKSRINNIKSLNIIMHDIFSKDVVDVGIDPADLFLISNAYLYTKTKEVLPMFVKDLLRIDGYIIASSGYDWFKDDHLKIEFHLGPTVGSWDFKLLKKVK